MIDSPKPCVVIPFDMLPEAKSWDNGKVYRVKLVLRQTGSSESGATFDVVDASSLEMRDKSARAYMLSDGGSYKM